MKLELFVAFRYLRARRKQAVVSVISLISVVGITAGVAALNIALALNTGFQKEFQERILGATSHVNLFPMAEQAISDYESLMQRTATLPEIRSAKATVYGQALLVSELREQPAVLKGVHADQDDLSRQIPPLSEGSLQDFQAGWIPSPIVLGGDLAQALGVAVGDPLRAMGLKGELSPMGRMPRLETFRVVAIFDSGLWQYDAHWALLPLTAAQEFFGYRSDQVSALEFRIGDIYQAPQIAREIGRRAGAGYGTNTWIELNRPLFSALKLEKLAMFVAIGLIVLVASLNIVSTLTLMVMEKNRDIAIITAMGGTSRTVMVVFMLQGLIIGLAGTLLGGLLGAGAVWYFDTYRVFQLEPQVYSIPYVPFELQGTDALLVSMIAVVISFLATLYPARAASRLDPVEALRYE